MSVESPSSPKVIDSITSSMTPATTAASTAVSNAVSSASTAASTAASNIHSVTSALTPEQAFQSVDLTDPSSVVQSIHTSEAMQKVKKAPKYLVYLDTTNAKILKELMEMFARVKTTLQGRDMINMEIANPEIVDVSKAKSKDSAMTKLLGLAKKILSNDASDERNQIESLYAYYAERARSYMFYSVSDLLKNSPVSSIECDLYHVQKDAMITQCKVAGINDDLTLAIEVRVPSGSEDDSVVYVGVSPFESLKPKVDTTVHDTTAVVANVVSRISRITSPDKGSHFEATADLELSDGGQSMLDRVGHASHASHALPYISEMAESLKASSQNQSQSGQNVQTGGASSHNSESTTVTSATPATPATPATSTTSSESTESSYSTPRIYSSAGVMRGGAYSTDAVGKHADPQVQTEIDKKLKELLDQSKTVNGSSSSGPAPGLCE